LLWPSIPAGAGDTGTGPPAVVVVDPRRSAALSKPDLSPTGLPLVSGAKVLVGLV
jgi:hypothetical protein